MSNRKSDVADKFVAVGRESLAKCVQQMGEVFARELDPKTAEKCRRELQSLVDEALATAESSGEQ